MFLRKTLLALSSVELRLLDDPLLHAERQFRSQGSELQDIDPEVLEASGQILPERIPDLKDPKYRYLKDKYLHE